MNTAGRGFLSSEVARGPLRAARKGDTISADYAVTTDDTTASDPPESRTEALPVRNHEIPGQSQRHSA